MKYILLLALSLIMACKPNTKTEDTATAEAEITYPENFEKVLEAHGGLDVWDTYQTLSFTMPGAGVNEVQTIDLHTRKDKVERGSATLGFDGTTVWLHDPENSYKGNPDFYHNLMFYFYAMPFVLADSGIIYEETEALEVNGTTYPGIKISFEPQTGASSNDEYFLYYDAETYQMRWLGYTATFGAAEKSTQVNYIAYDNWSAVEDILLPQSITWYGSEQGKITEARRTVNFEARSLDKQAKPDAFYQKPAASSENENL